MLKGMLAPGKQRISNINKKKKTDAEAIKGSETSEESDLDPEMQRS